MSANRDVLHAQASVAASQTDSVIVAAPAAGVRIRVVGLLVNPGATPSSVTFNSKGSGSGTAISPAFLTGASGVIATNGGVPIFSTNRSEALSVTTGAGSATGFAISYQLVP